MSDDSLSQDIEQEEEEIDILFTEIITKDKNLKEAVYNLTKTISKEQYDNIIIKVEQYYKQAKENVDMLKEDLGTYNGNKKNQYQQDLKKLVQSIERNYADLIRIKENRVIVSNLTYIAFEEQINTNGSDNDINTKSDKRLDTNNNNISRKTASSDSRKKKETDILVKQPKNNYDSVIDDNVNRKQQMKKGHDRVDEILAVYDANNIIIDNIIMIGNETIEIGTAASEKLKQQTERMDLVQKDLDDLGDGLKRAKKELSTFIRGTNCDKAVICIFIIAVLLMVGVIIAWQVAKYVCIKGVTNVCIGGYNSNSTSTINNIQVDILTILKKN